MKYKRSFVIPVLDGEKYDIRELLHDLMHIEGEVICVFNGKPIAHKRIDKFCQNSHNVGVSRAWNIGLNLVESDTVFILNSDVRVTEPTIRQLESYLYSLDRAVMVSPEGLNVSYEVCTTVDYFKNLDEPVCTDTISGFLFGINYKLFLDSKLAFDNRYSPCFIEEFDMGKQIQQAGLKCYAVPADGYSHEWGISAANNVKINYFGKEVLRDDVLEENIKVFKDKWA